MAGSSTSKKGTIAVSLTNYLDSGCIVAGASGLTLWATQFGLSSFAVGLLGAVSANAFGSAIGALIGGHLADKYGRKFIYTYNMLVYMLGVTIIMFAMNFPMLLIGFLVTGLSVGAGVPASWTYISEMADPSIRARNIGISQFAWSCGPAIIFTLGIIVSPLGLLGNRLLFLSLLIVAFVAWQLQRKLEESKDWEAEQVKMKESGNRLEHPFKTAFSSMVNVKSVLFLVGVYLFWNLVAGAMGFFMPFVYETVGGLSNTQANLLQAVLWILTAASTYFGFAKFGDRVSHRGLFFVGALMAVASWVVLTFVGMSWVGLWTFVILWGISAGIGAQAFYALWSTELFPTKYRGGVQGVMFFLVRGSTGVWSIVFPVILANLGFTVAGTIMIGLLTVSLLIGVIWAPKTRGRSLDDITKERYGNTID
ncbi:MFS transporter [Listeria monocytogenes]|jgi:Arabinose efflux permease|uniref:Lmo2850 protein n=10 Tax=Listeria TaxID=1637 RepID=Q926Q9_LISMO|nr:MULTISPECIES: MFS transporter [Listeria]NP_466372.1 sugar transporter [Listeria monocytogenes EGD-e]EAD5035605.1 MFS transporter [Listeria monocytogenes serotype 1/2a]EAE1679447.1 MFS transporter [Listeria monocytogenes LIS0071]EAE3702933.1 MFS transporter [Listeria monocytogenes serotype 1/2c]EAE3705157.1 MFS transporter [Listeria monocytogenes serotype 1/2b]EAE6021276.1 MFS transporter [Listeria monocytogenes serotype 3a]EAG6253865.1 MFS transporter [Listeria monocytogenes CFSAN003806]